MNKFELISKTEYDKVVAEEFNAKNGVIGFQSYDQLQVPKRATKGVLDMTLFPRSHSN